MKTLLIDNGTSLLEKLKGLVGNEVVVKKWTACSESDSNGYDLIVLSGSRDSSVMQDHGGFIKEINLIKSTRIPLVGICFGCELIAYAFGGRLSRLDDKREGMRDIHFLNADIFSGSDAKVYEGHRWVIAEMPKDFILLAKSEDGPEAIRHETLPIYGLQFHPENLADKLQGGEIFHKIVRSLVALK